MFTFVVEPLPKDASPEMTESSSNWILPYTKVECSNSGAFLGRDEEEGFLRFSHLLVLQLASFSYY
jgi:hypothetical protein